MKHCWHNQVDVRGNEIAARCCWCNVQRIDYDRSAHGPYYGGSGERLDRDGEDCPARIARDAGAFLNR